MNTFIEKLYDNFIKDDRYMYLVKGLGNTLMITFFAALIGIALGFVIAIIRSTYAKTGKFKVLNAICNVYLTIIRGTPVIVQLLIMYYVVFVSLNNKIFVAVIAFGINSGAYVSEIIRAGILSIDKGQTEAGRSLGLSAAQTMVNIVIPQAIKNIIPSLGNEVITVIKETAIVSMVGMYDLNMAAKDIGSGQNMASYVVPMFVAALFYLAVIYLITFVIKRIEKTLRKSERRA